MKISLITPAGASSRNGNSVTALRWKRIFTGLGHRVTLTERYSDARCDLMIALHARRSFKSIQNFHQWHPELPLIVALTGTDLYRDIKTSRNARRSLEMATRLVVLQARALRELPRRFHRKTRVIYQSAARVNGNVKWGHSFRVCVVGHLRPEKDPLRTALAVRHLPASSRISVLHIGRALTAPLGQRAAKETRQNPRYRWLGERSYGQTRRTIASSHLLSLTSLMEGSSNALSEALASSVPVVASRISGLVGTLGHHFPGYFPAGDTKALAHLLHRAETDPRFYRKLTSHCARLRPLVNPRRESDAWKNLLRELKS